MNQEPKPGDIGVLTFDGVKGEVRFITTNALDDNYVVVKDFRGALASIKKEFVQWDKQLEVTDKPIILDPNIDWHNDLDQESLKLGYRPLVKGEDKQSGDEYRFNVYEKWVKITEGGTTFSETFYRTKRPLVDATNEKRTKLVAKIEELEKEAYALRKELNKLNN